MINLKLLNLIKVSKYQIFFFVQIAAGAFTSSARTATQFWIENFDVVNVDYSFLANFNVLTTLKIDQCSNPPTAVNQLKNLPANLLQLMKISVDGVNIKQIGS